MEASNRFAAKLSWFLRRAQRSARNDDLSTTTRDAQRKPTPAWILVISYLRWAIPVAVSFVGIGYILVEQVVIGGHSLFEPTVVRALFIIGSAGPALVWITLTWAKSN